MHIHLLFTSVLQENSCCKGYSKNGLNESLNALKGITSGSALLSWVQCVSLEGEGTKKQAEEPGHRAGSHKGVLRMRQPGSQSSDCTQ